MCFMLSKALQPAKCVQENEGCYVLAAHYGGIPIYLYTYMGIYNWGLGETQQTWLWKAACGSGPFATFPQ